MTTRCRWVFFCLALFSLAFDAAAQIWTTNNFPRYILSLASSSDGSRVIAATGDGGVWISTDSGLSWSNHPFLGNAMLAGSSALGDILYVHSRGLRVSTNWGDTWYKMPLGGFLACSADGSKVLGQVTLTSLATSTNSAASWTTNSVPATNWSAGACSADGNKLIASYGGDGTHGGGIYTSTNFGANWKSNSIPGKNWSFVTSSADGDKLMAVAGSGEIYTSTNSGSTWVSNSVPRIPWIAAAPSADGRRLVAAADGGSIYSSTNSGLNWKSNAAPVTSWRWLASSADGGKLFAATFSSPYGFWHSEPPLSPRLNIRRGDSEIVFSWTVPSNSLGLQIWDPISGWSFLEGDAVLNLNTLQNEWSLSPTEDSGWFRLASH